MITKSVFTDQMNREVEVVFPPKRIVSLVPSQTELLYDLGLHDEVVGQTLFCIHPAEMHAVKPRVGGTKKPSIEKILALKPDLIIGNKEENDKETITELAKYCPVWMSDIQQLDDAVDMIVKIGELVNKETQAKILTQTIATSFARLTPNPQTSTLKHTVYLIWRSPWMAAGKNTFITDMMSRMGLENVAVNESSRYPELSDERLKALNPSLILLSSEPYPFKAKHIEELQLVCPQAQVLLVDGELFSWYGSRLLHSAEYFMALAQQIAK